MSRYKRLIFLSLVILLVTALTACSVLLKPAAETQPTAEPTLATAQPVQTSQAVLPPPGVVSDLANVESIEIQVDDQAMPVTINISARGVLADNCTQIDTVNVEKEGNTFNATIKTKRQDSGTCVASPLPFEKVFPLDVAGLPAGLYTVDVNGVIGTFQFTMDNVAPEAETTVSPAVGAGTASITGVLWHDLCAVAGSESDAGCVTSSEGVTRANGSLEPGEPGIEGVIVSLGQGDCPSQGYAEIVTNADGEYEFDNLAAGNYCVSIDENDARNSAKLLPGGWTFPSVGEGQLTVSLSEGEEKTAVNFGWDFQGATSVSATATPPVVGVTPISAACTNKAAFVTDVTVPENSGFQAGANFVKTWRIRNSGTCTWQSGYALVFSGGNQMAGTSPTVITGTVPPNGTVDISVKFVAPMVAGTYRSEWKLRTADGELFGIGENADKPLATQIVVTELGMVTPVSTAVGDVANLLPDLGSPTWVDTFDNDSNWYLMNDEFVTWVVSDGRLTMTSKLRDDIDRWGLSKHPPIKDFYLEIDAKTGGKCRGFDSYGMIVRAPNANAGYVYGFSCNGEFRLYKWDGKDFKGIQGWQPSRHIRTGPFASNRMGIMMKGGVIKLYANGHLLAEYFDEYYSEGFFGLFIGSEHTEGLSIMIAEIALWEFK